MDAHSLPPRPNLEQYRKQAKDLLRAVRASDHSAIARMRRHPRITDAGLAPSDSSSVALTDAQHVIAIEHAFSSWPTFAAHLEALAYAEAPVARFESAAEAIVNGDLRALERLLSDDPSLAHARSTRAHEATLLHYVAANGVEDFRQRSPANAVALAKALLAAGAKVDATAESYGGGPWQTTLTLLVSSVHPARAGVQVPLVDVLADYGAAVNGVSDDGVPLLTALAFHYADAASALVRRGARVDTLAAAAGVGDEALVRALLGARVPAHRTVKRAMPRWLQLAHDADTQRARALVWAAALGHLKVVTLLADAGVPLDATDPEGMTALHWAAWLGHLDVVDALVARGASLEARNRYGGTVLGATVWAAVNGGRSVDDARRDALPSVDYPPVVERLIAAGASVSAASYPSGHAGVDAVLARYSGQA